MKKIRFSISNEECGATLVEFALGASIFFITLFAAIQIGLLMMIQTALDTAAREASRFGVTGQIQTGLTREEAIKQKVLSVLKGYSGGIINPSKVKITVKSYNDLASLGRPEPYTDSNGNGVYNNGEPFTDVNGNGVWDADQGVSNSFGLPGQVVQYEISYTWNTLFPIFGNSSLVTLKGVTPVMNEDF